MGKNICVFCSSSNTLDKKYYEDARILGMLLAKNNMNLVYGGSALGLMNIIAKSVKENGAKTIGVVPQKLYEFGEYSRDCDEFHLTDGMRERKAKLDEISNAVVALAGGFGTLEEFSEMIVQKQLGYNNKPIIFLNTNGYYNNLLKFFDDIVNGHFAKSTAKDIYYVAETPQQVIDYLLAYDYSPKVVNKEDIYTQVIMK